jgi:hypothetical protein
VLTLGVAASVAANILHANPNPIAQAIAAWPPLALLLTVELISRIPVHRRSLAAVRLGATAAIAGIAAWVSYWHMAGVAARYGETGAAPYLLPLSVDGLVVVASVSLVELAGRLRAVEENSNMGRATANSDEIAPVPPASAPAEAPASGGASELVEAKPLAQPMPLAHAAAAQPQTQPAPLAQPQPAPLAAPRPAPLAQPQPELQPEPAGPLLSQNLREDLRERLGEHFGERLSTARPRQRTSPASARPTSTARVPEPTATGHAAPTTHGSAAIPSATARGPAPVPQRRGRPVEETRRLAAELAARQPDASTDDLAKQLGISTQRLKRVLSA